MFGGSSSQCHVLVCSVWMWHFLITLTYFFTLILTRYSYHKTYIYINVQQISPYKTRNHICNIQALAHKQSQLLFCLKLAVKVLYIDTWELMILSCIVSNSYPPKLSIGDPLLWICKKPLYLKEKCFIEIILMFYYSKYEILGLKV